MASHPNQPRARGPRSEELTLKRGVSRKVLDFNTCSPELQAQNKKYRRAWAKCYRMYAPRNFCNEPVQEGGLKIASILDGYLENDSWKDGEEIPSYIGDPNYDDGKRG